MAVEIHLHRNYMIGVGHFEIACYPHGHSVSGKSAVDEIRQQGEGLGLGQTAYRSFLCHLEAVGLLGHVPSGVAASAEFDSLLGQVVVHAVAFHIEGGGAHIVLSSLQLGPVGIVGEGDEYFGNTVGAQHAAVNSRHGVLISLSIEVGDGHPVGAGKRYIADFGALVCGEFIVVAVDMQLLVLGRE